MDHARARKALKRGGLSRREELNATLSSENTGQVSFDEVLAVHQALERLARFAERQSQVVELRFFGGLSLDETASVLRVDPRTVQRDWKLARAWLHREMNTSIDERP